jgi:hypothetical protein
VTVKVEQGNGSDFKGVVRIPNSTAATLTAVYGEHKSKFSSKIHKITIEVQPQ